MSVMRPGRAVGPQAGGPSDQGQYPSSFDALRGWSDNAGYSFVGAEVAVVDVTVPRAETCDLVMKGGVRASAGAIAPR
jgi:hypothetical protein